MSSSPFVWYVHSCSTLVLYILWMLCILWFNDRIEWWDGMIDGMSVSVRKFLRVAISDLNHSTVGDDSSFFFSNHSLSGFFFFKVLTKCCRWFVAWTPVHCYLSAESPLLIYLWLWPYESLYSSLTISCLAVLNYWIHITLVSFSLNSVMQLL